MQNTISRQFWRVLCGSKVLESPTWLKHPPVVEEENCWSALRTSRWTRIILLNPFMRFRLFAILRTENNCEKILSFILGIKHACFCIQRLTFILRLWFWWLWPELFGDHLSHISDALLFVQLSTGILWSSHRLLLVPLSYWILYKMNFGDLSAEKQKLSL